MTWSDPVELPPETDGGTVERDFVAVTYISAFAHEPRPELDGIDDALDQLLA